MIKRQRGRRERRLREGRETETETEREMTKVIGDKWTVRKKGESNEFLFTNVFHLLLIKWIVIIIKS